MNTRISNNVPMSRGKLCGSIIAHGSLWEWHSDCERACIDTTVSAYVKLVVRTLPVFVGIAMYK